MAVLFVSHSSKDDALASALEAWLRSEGFTDLFVDHKHMVGGVKWRQELRASAGSCRVVVCLVTENWLTSPECFAEFRAAWYMGKRIIPLFLLPSAPLESVEAQQRLVEICAEDQGIDLAPCRKLDSTLNIEADESVVNRLRSGLRATGALVTVGLDPEVFTINRSLRPMPFPGLASFGDDDADAALFYGRSNEIAEVLEELRKVRAERDLRPFVILGDSGAGKSSLLKAGIIPRLRREKPAWLPFRAFRPGADPLLNFAEAVARSLADFGEVEAHGAIRDRLFACWLKAERKDEELTPVGREALQKALEAEGQRLRKVANCEGATILISIDQAEELATAEGTSANALADCLQAALASAKGAWQLALTIRTDSFPELQKHPRFQNLKARCYDLRAVPVFRFENVVEEPAKRYGVSVEPALAHALMESAPKEDALPLLAFAMQRLWRQYAASKTLTRDNYNAVGGLKGLIEDAAERALRGLSPEQDVPLPSSLSKGRIALAASTFVPALVDINSQGAAIRRIAEWRNFSDEQQELLAKFDDWRLVVRKGETNSGTVELVHEALLREWTRLRGWLEPERERLEALQSLQIDALVWDRNGRGGIFLNHRKERLAKARALSGIDGYRQRVSNVENAYLAACQRAERLARSRTWGVGALLVLLSLTSVAAWAVEKYDVQRVRLQDTEAHLQVAIELKQSAEALSEYLRQQVTIEKENTETAIKREHEAAEKIQQADDAKRAADDQLKLLKEDRDRQERRLVELLARCQERPKN
jgi:hypothetical protein